MLKADLIRPRLKISNNEISPRFLPVDYQTLETANAITTIFQSHVGQRRAVLAEALRDFEGDRLDYPIIRGLASVLEGRCTFGNDPPVKPADLRATLFGQGPVTQKLDLFHQETRTQRLAEAATHYGLTTDQLEAALFADLAEEQILLDPGDPFPPSNLIARYNLEVARGILYWAREVRLQIYDTYKDLFKYIKLFKLMHTIHPLGDTPAAGYHVTLHGPISPFVQSTIRYGLQFAKFLPALLLCERWHMEADIQPPQVASATPLRYTLTDDTKLLSHFKGSDMFDSRLEADFAAEFAEKYEGGKRKWALTREDELILLGDTVMIPDFSLTHQKDGRRALVEIVGFWHPNYLQRKLEKVREAQRKDLVLLVYKSANVAEGAFEAASAGEVLMFTRKPVLKDVLAAVERSAV
ncbi:MAG: DUF790 family protein [Chloroflexota bacterium]